MNELKQHANLLLVILVLVVIKWCYIPIIDWQNQVYFSIQEKQKKQAKITKVLASEKEQTLKNDKIDKFLALSKQVFHEQEGESAFKLAQQKSIETLLDKHNLTLTRIVWENAIALNHLSAQHYLLRVYIKGEAYNVVQYITALESQSPYIEVSDFIFNIKRHKNNNIGTVSGNITLNLYTKPVRDLNASLHMPPMYIAKKYAAKNMSKLLADTLVTEPPFLATTSQETAG